MKNLKSFEEFIFESHKLNREIGINSNQKVDSIKESIITTSQYIGDAELYSELTVEQIVAYHALDDITNEGFLSKMRDKIKSLVSKKADIEGEGSMKKKEQINNAIDSMKDKMEAAKEKYNKEKEKLLNSGYVKTDSDKWTEAENEGWPPTETLTNPDGEEIYFVKGQEALKKDFDEKVKKWKDQGFTRWKPSGDEKYPDKEKYDYELVNTPKGNSVYFVKKLEVFSQEGEELEREKEKIDELVYKLKQKIGSIDKKMEDMVDWKDEDKIENLRGAQEKIYDEIRKLNKKRDDLDKEIDSIIAKNKE